MPIYIYYIIGFIVLVLLYGLRVVQQYKKAWFSALARLSKTCEPGLRWIIPVVDQMRKVDFRTITLPIPPQKSITKTTCLLMFRPWLITAC